MQESAIKTAGTRRHDPDFRNQAVSHTGLLHALSPVRVGLIGLDIKFITGSRFDWPSLFVSRGLLPYVSSTSLQNYPVAVPSDLQELKALCERVTRACYELKGQWIN